MNRLARGACSVVTVLLAFTLMTPAAALRSDEALAISQQVLGKEVRSQRLLDRSGVPVDLTSLRGRPVVLSLIYTSCYHSCTVATRHLAGIADIAWEALGEDAFTMVTVGFEAGVDTPDRMTSYARSQGVRAPGWKFLSGDQASIDALTADVGFTYEASARGFDHVAQVTVIDPEGRIYRQVYGDAFDPPALVEPLKELVLGRRAKALSIDGWISGVKLLCTIYDPASGRYQFDYSIFVGGAIGIACLGGLAIFLIRAWRESGARERGHGWRRSNPL